MSVQSQQVWFTVQQLPKEHVRSLVDDAQAIMHGSPNPDASQAARFLLSAVRAIHPDLVAQH